MGLEIKDLEKFHTVQLWESRLAPTTARNCKYSLKYFMKWLAGNGGRFKDYTPDQLIEYQKGVDNGSRYDILDLVKSYILSMDGRYGTKRNRYISLRSFFMHCRAELPREKFHFRGDTPKVQGDLSPGEIRDVVLSSKPVFQALFLSMLQGGMGLEEVAWWIINGLEDLEERLNEKTDIIKVDLPGRKMAKFRNPYYTYLGKDATHALRHWMRLREEKVKAEKAESPSYEDPRAIFLNQFGEPVSKKAIYNYWSRHMRTLGIVTPKSDGVLGNRYGKNPHEIRDTFRTLWAKSDAKPFVGEYLMGHQIDRYEYNKSASDEDFTRAEYRKAEPWLNIMSSGRPFGQVEEDEVQNLRDIVKELKTQLEVERRIKVEEAGKLSRLEKRVDEMMPAFNRFLRTMDQKKEKDKFRDAPAPARR